MVEFIVSGTPVCNTQWGKQGGDVVCKALGFNGQEPTKKEAKSDATKYYKTTCQGYEAKISDCSNLIENGVECKNNGHAYVNCETIPKFE